MPALFEMRLKIHPEKLRRQQKSAWKTFTNAKLCHLDARTTFLVWSWITSWSGFSGVRSANNPRDQCKLIQRGRPPCPPTVSATAVLPVSKPKLPSVHNVLRTVKQQLTLWGTALLQTDVLRLCCSSFSHIKQINHLRPRPVHLRFFSFSWGYVLLARVDGCSGVA